MTQAGRRGPGFATGPLPPLVVHAIYRLGVGGLENGLVNLINRMPSERYRHAVVCIDDYTEFRRRIERDDVAVYALHKRPGHDLRLLPRLLRLFRRLRPAIVHSRNLAGLDALVPALLAGVRHRIHGEHGRDQDDLDGSNLKLQRLRRLHRPLVSRYVALSAELERYLVERIGVAPERITRIINGVDTERFRCGRLPLPAPRLCDEGRLVIGTVGRLQAVKNQTALVEAFGLLIQRNPELRERVHLALIGDGPLRREVEQRVRDLGLGKRVWLAGARDDVPELMRGLDLFVLPSLAEGISNTLLEAMACGLPVVATDVGGNAELIDQGVTGLLVPPGDPALLAEAMATYLRDAEQCRRAGAEGRARAERLFSLDFMVARYLAVYDELLRGRPQA